ncbi:MAG: sodium:solute symporter [Tannerellaceae bacterium]|nr:sodium:solute symporter [Tannerellaceae bacterium]
MTIVDYIVFFVFITGTILFGISFYSKNKSAKEYTEAGGRMPGWVVGMSIFATYVSSISFLALPGNAYIGNWNSFVFSLSIPFALWIAARYFVPFYRNLGSVSAYSFLEERFGYWARVYASCCYLLTQVARTGSVLFLMALPLHTMMGWSVPAIIVIMGICVVAYSVLGGITAVMWNDAIQGIILIAGAVTCVAVLLFSMPEGVSRAMAVAMESDKFSLGSFGLDLGSATFWVTLVYGIFINLQNYGIDQNFIQRYKTAKDLKSARSGTLFGGLLYIPVSMFFLFIGTVLFVYYKTGGTLPDGISGDAVFPYFIVHGLPTGVTGLLIAAICAAGLSTVSTSINSGATIILADFFRHKRTLTAKQDMLVLYGASLVLGILGIALGFAMMTVQSALEAWWSLAGIFSGGMLGLFLLGFLSKKVKNVHAAAGVACGVALIAWMSVRHTAFHSYLTIVFGTIVIFLAGFLLSAIPGLVKRTSDFK